MTKPVRALAVVREGDRLLLRSWRPLLTHGLAAQALVALILAPLFLWLMTEMMSVARSDVILNYDIASLALSPEGAGLGILWCLVASMLSVVALGGLALISAAAHRDSTLARGFVWRRVLASLPRMLGTGILKVAAWFFVLVPIVGATATALVALLLAPFDYGPVEHWLPDELGEIAWLTPVAAVVAALGIFLYVRWLLTMHCMVLERISLTRAIRRSRELVRGRFWLVFRCLLLHHVTIGILAVLFSLLLGWADLLVAEATPAEGGGNYRYLVALLMVVNFAALAVGTVLAVCRGISIITVLYFRLQGDDPPVDLETVERPSGQHRGKRRLAAAALLFGALGGATALTLPRVNAAIKELENAVAVTAHRGSSAEAPENTLASVRLAIQDGAHYAEIDVQQAKDGAVVMLHDESLDRVAGVKRRVWEMTGEELRALDVGSWFDPGYHEERIVPLAEVIELAKGRMRLNIEIKVHGKEDETFVPDVVEIVRQAGFEKECVITSLDYAALQKVRALAPELRLGMIVSARVGRIGSLDVDFYSVQPAIATIGFIRNAHESGREVHVWTLNEAAMIQRYIDRGVDNVITDYPKRALHVLESRTEADEIYAAVLRLFRR